MRPYFTEHFKKQLKRLSKKFPHVKEDLINHLNVLDLENEIAIGNSVYKIRIKSVDLNKGKSGGFRSYLYFFVRKTLIVPLVIYSKSEKENLSERELQDHIHETIAELLTRFR